MTAAKIQARRQKLSMNDSDSASLCTISYRCAHAWLSAVAGSAPRAAKRADQRLVAVPHVGVVEAHVGRQLRLMGLGAALEQRGHRGDADAAADGPDEVEEAGGVAQLAHRGRR